MQNRERSIGLVCAEPFRIFFPVGLLLGIAGVSFWPLVYLGVDTSMPRLLSSDACVD